MDPQPPSLMVAEKMGWLTSKCKRHDDGFSFLFPIYFPSFHFDTQPSQGSNELAHTEQFGEDSSNLAALAAVIPQVCGIRMAR